jgi:hypothetical protein
MDSEGILIFQFDLTEKDIVKKHCKKDIHLVQFSYCYF